MDVLSVEQAADFLQCAASRVYRLIHNQQVNATKVNRYWYICQRSLGEFFQSEMLERGNELIENEDYSAAIKVFERLIRHFPEHVEAHFLLAHAAEENQELRLAKKYYRKCVQHFHYAPAHLPLARIYFEQRRYSQALKHFEHLRSEPDIQVLYHLGLTYQALNRPEEALEALNQALEVDPTYARVYDALGYFYFEGKDYTQALEHYQSAWALDMDNEAYCAGIAHSYRALENYEEAKHWYQKALALPQVEPQLHYELALVAEKAQDEALAISAYTSYLKYFPYSEEALYHLASLHVEQAEHQEAAPLLARLVDLEPEHWQAQHSLALVHTQLNNAMKAQKAYAAALKHAPESEQAHIYANQACFFLAQEQLLQAEQACQAALDLDAQNYLAQTTLAQIKVQQAEYEQALTLYESLLPHAESTLLHYNLGTCYMHVGQSRKAIEVYLQALEQEPQSTRLLHALGLAYQACRDHLKSIRYFYRALAIDAEHIPSLYNLGQIFLDQHDYKQSLKWFAKLTERAPEYIEGWIQKGFVLDNLNRIEEAIQSYRKALSIDSSNLSVYMILGLACSRSGRVDEALNIYRQALTLLPQEAGEIYYLMGLAYLNDLDDLAAAEMFELSLRNPGRCQREAAQHLGQIYLQEGKAAAAINCFRKLLAADMQDARAYVYLAQAYAMKGDVKRFHKYCNTALSIKPKDPDILYQVALLYFREQEWREALSYFQQLVSIQPDHVRANNYLGTIFRSMGCKLEALKAFQKSVEADPDYCVGYLNLSYTYFDMHELGRALQFCNKAIACEPECAEPYYWQGHLFFTAEKWSDAVKSFEQALHYEPDHPKALKWLPLARQQWIRVRNGTQPLRGASAR